MAVFSSLAMLCKETGVTALPILAVWAALQRRASGAGGLTKQALSSLCKYGLVVSHSTLLEMKNNYIEPDSTL